MVLRKKSFLAIVVLVTFSFQIFCASVQKNEKKEMSKKEKEFYTAANKLIDEKEFDEVIELSDKHIKNDPNNAIYHQFKGLALVMDYASSPWPTWMRGKSDIKKAIIEFKTALKLQPANEEKVLSAIALAHVVSKDLDKAKEIFEPAIKKYPDSIHLNFVGIKYYEMKGNINPSKKSECEAFVKKHNPKYNGKPVFGGIGVAISLWTLVKILTAAIITGYIAGFKQGWEMRL